MRTFDFAVAAMGVQYSIFRNGRKLHTLLGLDQTPEGVSLPFDTDVRIGDIISNDVASTLETVKAVESIMTADGKEVDSLLVHFRLPNPAPSKQVTYNINNVHNSAIGENAMCYNSIVDLEKVIINHGYSLDEFKPLLDAINDLTTKESCPKGSLGKFADLLSKHSWLSAPVAQILLAYFMGNVNI